MRPQRTVQALIDRKHERYEAISQARAKISEPGLEYTELRAAFEDIVPKSVGTVDSSFLPAYFGSMIFFRGWYS